MAAGQFYKKKNLSAENIKQSFYRWKLYALLVVGERNSHNSLNKICCFLPDSDGLHCWRSKNCFGPDRLLGALRPFDLFASPRKSTDFVSL